VLGAGCWVLGARCGVWIKQLSYSLLPIPCSLLPIPYSLLPFLKQLMIRRRSTPWIHKWSRILIAVVAACGAITTGYLTIEKFAGKSAACVAGAGARNCNDVLSSPWATIFGQPLALFGFLAYTGMLILALAPLLIKLDESKDKHKGVTDSRDDLAQLATNSPLFQQPTHLAVMQRQRKKLENLTWPLLLVGAIAMSVFSGYLMYLLAFQIKAVCLYCIASALFSLSMLVLTIIGRPWEDVGQILFIALIVGMVTLVGTLGVYRDVNNPVASTDGKVQLGAYVPQEKPDAGIGGWEITTTSGEAEKALASHLVKVGAKEYVAYWCPHCHEQKLLFGKEAYQELEKNTVKVECAGDSPQGKPEECQKAGIKSFPSWIINGQTYAGVQNLEQLANLTGYTGPRNFKYLR